ncbi:MAG: OmpA family protein, partial [Candidatus Kapaibacteriota bacterium]
MHIYRKILTYSGHVAFLCFFLMLSSCVSTSTFEAQVQKADSLQKALNGSINEKKDLLSKQAGNLAIIDDLQSEIRVLKQKIRILEEQLDQAKKASSDEIKSLLSQLEKAEEDLFARETKLRDLQALMKQRDSSMNALRESVEKSLLGFKDSGLEIEVKNGKVYVKMSNQLLFKSGSTSIDKRGREALQQLATVLAQQTEISIMIEGHTDNVPINSSRFADNWDLSVLRSTEVARILTIENGIDPKRIIASGRSEFMPISELNDPESRAKNRRTEIILSPKLDELLNLVK